MHQDQIIKNMAPRRFTEIAREYHLARFEEAHSHMVQADTLRVMSFTNLRDPFSPRRELTSI
jgi:hypothetical protein